MNREMFTREEVLSLINDENRERFNEIDVFNFWDESYRNEAEWSWYLKGELHDYVEGLASRYEKTIDLRELAEWSDDSEKMKKLVEESGYTHVNWDW